MTGAQFFTVSEVGMKLAPYYCHILSLVYSNLYKVGAKFIYPRADLSMLNCSSWLREDLEKIFISVSDVEILEVPLFKLFINCFILSKKLRAVIVLEYYLLEGRTSDDWIHIICDPISVWYTPKVLK